MAFSRQSLRVVVLVCPVCTHFSQVPEARPPATQMLKVLLLLRVRAEAAERPRLRSGSLAVKHHNAIVGRSCDITVCSVEVLEEPEDAITEP